MLAHPKPTRAKRSKRSAPSLQAHYDRVASLPSCVSGHRPVVLHHVKVTTSKGVVLRKLSGARAAVVPLTEAEHQEAHAWGDAQFEEMHGLPLGHLVSVACGLLSETVVGR